MGELTPIGLPSSTSQSRSGLVSSTRLINCYRETEGGDAKNSFAIVAINGFEDYAELTGSTGGVRGMLDLGNELLAVSGNQVYTVSPAGAVSLIAGLPGAGLITMARNRVSPSPQAAVVSSDGRWYIYQNGTLVESPDPDLVAPIYVTHKDGYFVFLLQSGTFYISAIDDDAIDGLDFATAQTSADEGVALATRGTDLIIFGSKSTEFWTNTGNADFPFELQAYRGFGCYSAGSVSEISALVGGSMVDSVIWCATDERGKFAGVYLLSGYEAIKISDYDLDRLIEDDPSPEALRGFAWSENGHSFYAIRGANFCYTYDTKEQVWHERRSFGQDTWSISRHETFRGLTLFGDAATGNIYRSDINLYEADDQSIQMEIQIPITHAWPYELILNRVAVDAVTGTGANTTDADLASPEIVFDMSLDGGANFGTELHRSLGSQGQTQTTMNWFGLGRIGRTGTVLRFRLSPGVKRIVMGAAVDVDRLAA